MNCRSATALIYSFVLFVMSTAAIAQQLPTGVSVKQIQPGITAISADSGNWGGESLGTSHQNTNQYQIEKTLYVPPGSLEGVREARLRVFMAIYDNSGGTNGLDESFVYTINGKPHAVPDNEPTLPGAKWEWHDFTIPVSELKTGDNIFVFTKSYSEKNDDYLYIGIGTPTSYGFSRMSQDGGKTWTKESLNSIKAVGEYMVQLLLLKELPQSAENWSPQSAGSNRLIGYSGIETDDDKSYLSLELDPSEIDPKQDFRVAIQTRGAAPTVRWLNGNDKPISPVSSDFKDGILTVTLPRSREPLARLEIEAESPNAMPVSQVRFDYSRRIEAEKRRRVNMAPLVAAAKGTPQKRAPRARLTPGGFILENATQVATFSTTPDLRLSALRNEYSQQNVLVHSELTHLFLTEVEGKRFGAEDWQVKGVKAISSTAIEVALALPSPALTAKFTIAIDREMLRFGLQITNASATTQTWKTAFPQIGGLQLSPDEKDDYFLFPIWGGAIASQNVNLRTFYGDESAWWQMTTVFSPQQGTGLSLRCLDETGLFKGVALRKGQTPVEGGNFMRSTNSSGMDLDMGWQDSLESGPGTAMGFEYIKHTRPPGGSFAPPSAAIQMYAGDWHSAMQTYVDWAHKVWKWRPWPSKVRDRWNIISPGWQQKPLVVKDGDGIKWRTDYIDSKTSDIAEMMSWWQWSKKGPWQVPMDQLKERLGNGLFTAYKTYWVINPATGQLEYPINRGDYDYNTDWGGLPALRKQIQAIRDGGQQPWFYTDPFLADDNTELAQKYGRQYGIMNPRYNDYNNVPLNPKGYVSDYASWNMCLDTAWYQKFVTDQTTRIVRDTGIDGIRFDQFGLNAYACSNSQHKHVFSEPGQNNNLQATALMCRMVHESVDKVKPDFVLTAEFVGYDHLGATLEGSVNYESARQTFDGFRPIPLNVFRFYFPEHKPFDLDDKQRTHGREWRFWNASGAFDTLHPPRYFRILKENSDAFDSRKTTPLVPTLQEGIYANRFEGGGKSITILYNAHGFTVNRPLISAPAKKGFHYFDLLNGREIVTEKNAIAMKVRPNQIATIAMLPQVLSVQSSTGSWKVNLSRKVANVAVLVCNAEGEELKRYDVKGQSILITDTKIAGATYLKMLSGNYLVDARALPLAK